MLTEEHRRIRGTWVDVDRVHIATMVEFGFENPENSVRVFFRQTHLFAVLFNRKNRRTLGFFVVDVLIHFLFDHQIDRLNQDRGHPVIGQRTDLFLPVVRLVRVGGKNQIAARIHRNVGR